jgi:glycosyltransferase involved in cell wall biosynthesis
MKITVIIPRYTIAGVPLAQIRLARAFALQGHKVDLVVGYIEKNSKMPVFNNVKILHLNKKKVRQMFTQIIFYLIKNKPQIIFSAEDHLNICISLSTIFSFSKAKLSCSSRVTPYDTYSNKIFTKRWFLKYLNKLTSWRVDALTCVSEDMVKQYHAVLNSKKHICIYNIIDDSHSRKLMNEKANHEWLINKNCKIIIAAGKLAPWKGFDNLIKSFEIVKKSMNVKLIILGDGPERYKLNSIILKLNLEHEVSLPGYVSNPLSYFIKSDVFVLSSTVEGMPNVLVEAMMCGCTPVSTDCPTGPRELLQSNQNGYLVPVNDKFAMSSSIISALNKPIPASILNKAVQPFQENVIINKHFSSININ